MTNPPTFRPKDCRTCGATFIPGSGNATYCSPCGRDKVAQSKRDSHSRFFKANRWYQYRIPLSRVEMALEDQGGCCPGCGVALEFDVDRSAHNRGVIDHDHRCGPKPCAKCFRGVLCHPCNIFIGAVLEDPSRLSPRQSAYLRRSTRMLAAA